MRDLVAPDFVDGGEPLAAVPALVLLVVGVVHDVVPVQVDVVLHSDVANLARYRQCLVLGPVRPRMHLWGKLGPCMWQKFLQNLLGKSKNQI